MEILHALFLGIIQGVTEFLPISSSGHLILTRAVFGWQDAGISFDILLHFGTLLAILFYFWRIWKKIVVGFFQNNQEERKKVWGIILATLPAVVFGYLSEGLIETYFRSVLKVGILMIAAGICFVIVEWWQSRRKVARSVVTFSFWDYLFVGLIQTIALLPGISRSGMTIVGGMIRGLSRTAAAEFSFVLAVPAILGATTYDLLKNYQVLAGLNLMPLAVGFLTAMIVGYLSIKFLMFYLSKHKLNVFAYYLVVIGLIAIFLSK